MKMRMIFKVGVLTSRHGYTLPFTCGTAFLLIASLSILAACIFNIYKYILFIFVLHMTSVFIVLIIKITIIMLSVLDVWIVHLPAGRQSRPRARLRCHCRGGDGQVQSCHWSCWLGKVLRLRTDFVKMLRFSASLVHYYLCQFG